MVDIISPTVAPADKPNPDTDAVVQFLKLFAPDGPWILAALKPAGGGPEVKTFGPDAEADARSWKDNATGSVMSLRVIGAGWST